MTAQLTKGTFDLGIVADDFDAMLAFYGETLGFDRLGTVPLEPDGTIHLLVAGEAMVKLVEVPSTTPGPKGQIRDASGFRYLTFWVSNLTDLIAECVGAGVDVVREPFEVMPGLTAVVVTDPDGNLVEFLQQS